MPYKYREYRKQQADIAKVEDQATKKVEQVEKVKSPHVETKKPKNSPRIKAKA